MGAPEYSFDNPEIRAAPLCRLQCVSDPRLSLGAGKTAKGLRMTSGFNFSRSDLKKMEREIVSDVRKETQRFFDSFTRRYSGRPVLTIKAALRQEWKRRMDGTMSDAELNDYAELIAGGGTIKVQ